MGAGRLSQFCAVKSCEGMFQLIFVLTVQLLISLGERLDLLKSRLGPKPTKF